MTLIKNPTAYPNKVPLTGNERLIGTNDDNANGKTMNFKTSDLLAYIQANLTGGIDQDNIFIQQRLLYEGVATNEVLAELVNDLETFTIGEKQIYIFYASALITEGDPIPPEFKFVILNNGKGTYGQEGTALTADDIEVIYSGALSYSGVIQDPNTQVVDLEEIGTDNIWDVLNAESPAITIQPQADGYTIVTATRSGQEVNYLWIGAGGLYGSGELQATEFDVKLLSGITGNGLDETLNIGNESKLPATIGALFLHYATSLPTTPADRAVMIFRDHSVTWIYPNGDNFSFTSTSGYSPTITMPLANGLMETQRPVTTISAASYNWSSPTYPLDWFSQCINFNLAGGQALTIGTFAGVVGRELKMVKTNSGNLTITPDASWTVNGAPAAPIVVAPFKMITIKKIATAELIINIDSLP